MFKLLLRFMVILDVYKSFTPNKTTFTEYFFTYSMDFKATWQT